MPHGAESRGEALSQESPNESYFHSQVMTLSIRNLYYILLGWTGCKRLWKKKPG